VERASLWERKPEPEREFRALRVLPQAAQQLAVPTLQGV
jgi:hypothetical protein